MIPYCSICWDVDKVKLLDQRRLPAEELYLEITDYHEIIEAIRTLAIRGAPAIGVAAAMGAALGALDFGYPGRQGVPVALSRSFAGRLPPPVPPRSISFGLWIGCCW